MEGDPPDIQPENESLETGTVNPLAALRARLDRLQRLGLAVQDVLDEVACALERAGVSCGGGKLRVEPGCQPIACVVWNHSSTALVLRHGGRGGAGAGLQSVRRPRPALPCRSPRPWPVQALLSWQDPSVTLGVLVVLSAAALLIFLLGLPTVLASALCFVIRPPALRSPTPPLPAVVFDKLPTRRDRIV
jgi:hypothetical protein